MKIQVLDKSKDIAVLVRNETLVCSHCGSTPTNQTEDCKWCDGKGSENPFVDDEGEPHHDYPEKNY